MSGSYGSTTGTDERDSRALMERLMVFNIADEIAALRDESEWRENEKNARTLAKDVDFRAVLAVMHVGSTIEERDGDARASLQLFEGGADLEVDGQTAALTSGRVAVVDSGQPWVLHATSDCALLITLAWPVEKAGV